jgi:hypothetical protein
VCGSNSGHKGAFYFIQCQLPLRGKLTDQDFSTMEEGSPETRIFLLNSRLAAASKPKLDTFAHENLEHLATTTPRRCIGEGQVRSGQVYYSAEA